MRATDRRRAVAAASSTASALGLTVDDAVVLNDSNRLVVHLRPCDTVARVSPLTHHAGHRASAGREVEVVRHLAPMGIPVAPLEPRVEPRVVVRDGFEITLWARLEAATARDLPPVEYARALDALHAGLRRTAIVAPHVVDRIAATQRDVADRDVTPDLTEADRELLATTLRDLRRSIADGRPGEQVLHGEPHPWNVLDTSDGPLFIDFENCARGPVEYDLGWVPRAVSARHPGADQDLVDACRGVVLAIVAAHRWRGDDLHPSGRASGVAFLDALRAGPPWPALDEVVW